MDNLIRRRKEHGRHEVQHNDISYLINPFATNSNSNAEENAENTDSFEINQGRVERQDKEFQHQIHVSSAKGSPVRFFSRTPINSMQIANNHAQHSLLSEFFRPHSYIENNETYVSMSLARDKERIHIQNLRSKNTYDIQSLNDSMILSKKEDKNNGFYETKQGKSIYSQSNRSRYSPIKSITDASHNLNNLIQPSLHNDFDKRSNTTYKQTNANFFKKMDPNEEPLHLRNKKNNIGYREMNSQLINDRIDENLVRGQEKKVGQHDPFMKNEVEVDQSLLYAMNGIERKGCEESDLLNLGVNPIRTDSGLLLTHRQAPTLPYTEPFANSRSVYKKQPNTHFNNQTNPYDHFGASVQNVQEPNKRCLNPSSQKNNGIKYVLETSSMRNDRPMNPMRRSGVTPFQLSINKERGKKMRIDLHSWVLRFLAMLVLSTTISFVYFWRQEGSPSNIRQPTILKNENANYKSQLTNSMLKVSLDIVNQSEGKSRIKEKRNELPKSSNTSTFIIGEIPNVNKRHRNLRELKEEFEGWVLKHSKSYDTEEEKETRFRNWMKNHHRYASNMCF